MQQIGEIAKKHAYKNKKGEEQHLNINAIPNNMEKYMAFMFGKHLNNETNDLILNLTPENMTQHSRLE